MPLVVPLLCRLLPLLCPIFRRTHTQLAHAVEVRPETARHCLGRQHVLSHPVQGPRSQLAAGELTAMRTYGGVDGTPYRGALVCLEADGGGGGV